MIHCKQDTKCMHFIPPYLALAVTWHWELSPVTEQLRAAQESLLISLCDVSPVCMQKGKPKKT